MPNFTLRLKPIVLDIDASTQAGALTEFADELMNKAYWLKAEDFVYIKESEVCPKCSGTGNIVTGVTNTKCTVCKGT